MLLFKSAVAGILKFFKFVKGLYNKMSLSLVLSLISVTCLAVSGTILTIGVRQLKFLSRQELFVESSGSIGPDVTIIVPACNEAENIRGAILSLLNQSYEQLEIIVVNDRSIDGTGDILSQIQKDYKELVVLEINSLPEGWMGKSHALHLAATHAKGEYLIFTDADVRLEKTVVSRAVHYMLAQKLDHLTLLFNNTTPGWLLNCFILDCGLGLLTLFRPWSVAKDDSASFIGVGAFNMIKASTYEIIGGHESFKMHPVDDVMLGKTVKENGYAQDCLVGGELVSLPWYGSLKEMINGLEKNMFSMVHYHAILLFPVLAAIFTVTIFPIWGILFGTFSVRFFCLLALFLRLLIFYQGLKRQNLPVTYLPGALVTPFITCYALVNAVYTNTKNNGIIWRGSYYSLAKLRKSRSILF